MNKLSQKDLQKYLAFLADANAAKGKSKDSSTKVGAIVVDDDFNYRISGYNGFPRKVDESKLERHKRPTKYKFTAHAEENCIAQAARTGVSLKGCTLILTSLFPCTTCARLIIQSGIKRVIAPRQNVGSEISNENRLDWDEEMVYSMEMFTEAEVEVVFYD